MGRRLVFALVITLLFFIFVSKKVSAEVLSITATVPVSDVWAEAIANNSQVTSTRSGQRVSFFVRVKGPSYETLYNHKVQFEVFLDGKLIATFVREGKEIALFSFVAPKEDLYRFTITDITWERKIKLKEGEFIHQPLIKTFKAWVTLFLLNKKYANANTPLIASNAFLTGNPIKRVVE